MGNKGSVKKLIGEEQDVTNHESAGSVLMALVLGESVLGDLDILHHTLGRFGESGTSFDLELCQHVPLGVVGD